MDDSEALARLRCEQLVARLHLRPHAEGGCYVRMYTSDASVFAGASARPASTAIWYLLGPGERSLWHVVDADEIWHHVEGETLNLLIYHPSDGTLEQHRLGTFDDNALPVLVVPRGCWQAVVEVADYALCTCVVAPGFEYRGFSLIRDLGVEGAEPFRDTLAEWEYLR